MKASERIISLKIKDMLSKFNVFINMKFNQVTEILHNIPHMTAKQGEIVYSLVKNTNIANVLELGFAHGVSTQYMAAAFDEKGYGQITSIDRHEAKDRKPNIFELLKTSKLDKYINLIFANETYNWELLNLINANTKDGVCQPLYDFCFIDGSHNFQIDCAAFFLADKLLMPGGMLLLDDLFWTYESSASLKDSDFVKCMSEDERTIPHIKKLFDLIVTQHPDYTDFRVEGTWAWARKKPDAKTKINVNLDNVYSNLSVKSIIKEAIVKLKNRSKRHIES